MVNLKELSRTPGNCFSCRFLHSFLRCGVFNCLTYGKFCCETNHPPKETCNSWEEKHEQSALTLDGAFIGVSNNSINGKLTREEYNSLKCNEPDLIYPVNEITEERYTGIMSRISFISEDISLYSFF